jgi:hypothetical protein
MLVPTKKVWTTSVSALGYRLHELGVMSDWQYRSFCVQIAKRGRNKEPEAGATGDVAYPSPYPPALYEEGVTRTQIAQGLCLPSTELEQLLLGLAITGLDGGRKQSPSQVTTSLRRVK